MDGQAEKKLFSEVPVISGSRLCLKPLGPEHTGALRMIVDYLYNETETEIITASMMVENLASARVLTKNGFSLVVHAVDEDWGYDRPTVADKWIQ